MTPSRTLLNFLILCFCFNVLAFVTIFPLVAMTDLTPNAGYAQTITFKILYGIHTTFALGATILWVYCIYFFYKYDKYSKGILKIIFFPGLFSMFYFYRVIWKRKRPLDNEITHEPVLGKTVYLVNDDDTEK
jgi:hypothetical protein